MSSNWRVKVPHSLTVAALSVLCAGSFALACWQVRSFWPPVVIVSDEYQGTIMPTVLPPGTYAVTPLKVGSILPPLDAAGWINGNPDRKDARLVVVDVWSHWCDACVLTAPGLVQLQQKFADRQVAFISLTNVDREQVEAFAERGSISWSCGYGASFDRLSHMGTCNADPMSPTYRPGQEVWPTIYLVDAGGQVLWHDNQGRPQHLKHPDQIVRDLEAEIERLLAVEIAKA